MTVTADTATKPEVTPNEGLEHIQSKLDQTDGPQTEPSVLPNPLAEGSEGSQSDESQVEKTDEENPLVEQAIKDFGFDQKLVEGKSDAEIRALMTAYDEILLKQNQQNTTGQTAVDPQPQAGGDQSTAETPSDQIEAPNWEEFDEQAQEAFNYFKQENTQLQTKVGQLEQILIQMHQESQQSRLKPIQDKFEETVSQLGSEFFGTGPDLSPQQDQMRDQLWSTAAALGQSYESQGKQAPPIENLVQRAVAALDYEKFIKRDEVLDQARKQSKQIIGQPNFGEQHAESLSSRDQGIQAIEAMRVKYGN